MTRLNLLLALLLLTRWIDSSQAATFKQNSALMTVLTATGVSQLQEIDLSSGNVLQQITLSGSFSNLFSQTVLDQKGEKVAIGLGDGTTNGIGLQFNIQGQQVGSTTQITGRKVTTMFWVADPDAWFIIDNSLYHSLIGTTTSTPQTIHESGTLLCAQPVGSKLYAIVNNVLSLMNPIQTSTPGSFTTVISGFSVAAFYIKDTRVYVYSSSTSTLARYDLNAQGTSATFTYSQGGVSITLVSGMYAVDVSGVTYIAITSYGSQLIRFTDTGSAINSRTVLLSGDDAYVGLGPVPKPTCTDTFKNQDETDVDCGGATCSKCAIGKSCSSNSDCSSDKCTSNVCAASCTDSIKNQDETDVDCGGATCSKCANSKSCSASTDCTSGFCNASNKCATPTCLDSAKNQDETDVDCGGATCSKCAIGKTCSINTDCSSNKCTGSVCAASCTDGITNQDETDVDCGGNTCSTRCANGKSCLLGTDCSENYCNPDFKCSTESCNDGYRNQDETDVDCGGEACITRCNVGQLCSLNSDCDSNTCSGGVCTMALVAPPIAPPVNVPIAVPDGAPIKTPIDTPVNAPLDTPVSAPLDTPVEPTPEEVPQAENTPVFPVNTPSKKLVSDGMIAAMSVIGLVIAVVMLAL